MGNGEKEMRAEENEVSNGEYQGIKENGNKEEKQELKPETEKRESEKQTRMYLCHSPLQFSCLYTSDFFFEKDKATQVTDILQMLLKRKKKRVIYAGISARTQIKPSVARYCRAMQLQHAEKYFVRIETYVIITPCDSHFIKRRIDKPALSV